MFQILQEPVTALTQHTKTPIAFTVDSMFEVRHNAAGKWELIEVRLDAPYVKDYDAIEAPATWSARFDMTNWCLFGAYRHEQRVGGALIAFDTPGVDMLEGRKDLAVPWDLRVRPNVRRHGVGTMLLTAVLEWALARDCKEVKVETQDVNVAACRFYARQRFELRTVNRDAYASLPDEVQLLWYKPL